MSTNYRWMKILTAIYAFRGLLCHLGNVADLQILPAPESDILQPSQASKNPHKQMGLSETQADTGHGNIKTFFCPSLKTFPFTLCKRTEWLSLIMFRNDVKRMSLSHHHDLLSFTMYNIQKYRVPKFTVSKRQ